MQKQSFRQPRKPTFKQRLNKKILQIHFMCRASDIIVPVDMAWLLTLSPKRIHLLHRRVTFLYKAGIIRCDRIVAHQIVLPPLVPTGELS